MKRFTNIRVFHDDDVVQHILSKDGNGENGKTPKRSLGRGIEYRMSRSKVNYNEDTDEEDETMMSTGFSSSALDAGDPDSVYGSDLFKFKSIKKAGQMTLKAQTISTPQTPKGKAVTQDAESPIRGKRSPAPLQRTPSRRSKPTVESPIALERTPTRRSKSGPLTPIPQRLAGPAQRQHNKAEQSTPYRLRKRNATLADGDAGSGSDDSVDETTSEEEEEEEMDMDNRVNLDGRQIKSKETDLMASAETYFDVHSMNPVTSDRTLASLDTPRMDVQSIRQVLKQLTASHVKETTSLMDSHKELFDRWMLNMCQGYNILTFGLGSKLPVLSAFRRSHLNSFSHVVVNGYFPSLTVKHILNSITEEIMEETKSFTNLFYHIEFIDQYFKTHDEDFYLIINNIDGVLLRSKKCQNVLSLLAAIEGVHIIASVDHINASFLWDEIQFFRLRWLWYDTTTFMAYEAENSYENSLMVQQSGGLALSSLVHVMRSLTPNAKRIFLLLAEYQLQEVSNATNYEGMSFQVLYQKCREDFLVNSDLTLQAQLVEFKDHRLIRAKKNFEGIEHLLIPIDKSTLKIFLDEQKENK